MRAIFDHPGLFLPVAVVLLLLAGWLGTLLRPLRPALIGTEHRTDLNIVQAAVLALLGLLLGFSFAMSVERYDQRRQLEIDEANAIQVLWFRTSLLGNPARTTMRHLIREYVPVRLSFLSAGLDTGKLADAAHQTRGLHEKLWLAEVDAHIQSDTLNVFLMNALNDCFVLSEKRTAALENRIPTMAWIMLLFMASVASFLIGLSVNARTPLLLFVVPVVVGSALTLILDLDTPRSGFVRVQQQSLERVGREISAMPD